MMGADCKRSTDLWAVIEAFQDVSNCPSKSLSIPPSVARCSTWRDSPLGDAEKIKDESGKRATPSDASMTRFQWLVVTF
jgi:hypothetical protein